MLIEHLLKVAQVGVDAVLYGLILLSAISLAIILERVWFFRKQERGSRALGERLRAPLREGDAEGARRICHESKTVHGEIMSEALEWFSAGPESFAEILEKATRERKRELEAGLVFLGTVGNNAPFVGLFGTVLGIVTAFRALGENAANNAAMGNVMSAIGEALVATAVGILVALPAVVGFNMCQKKLGEVEDGIAALGSLALAELRRPGHKVKAAAGTGS